MITLINASFISFIWQLTSYESHSKTESRRLAKSGQLLTRQPNHHWFLLPGGGLPVYIYIYVYVYIYIYIYICIIYTYAHINTYVCIYIYIYACAYTRGYAGSYLYVGTLTRLRPPHMFYWYWCMWPHIPMHLEISVYYLYVHICTYEDWKCAPV